MVKELIKARKKSMATRYFLENYMQEWRAKKILGWKTSEKILILGGILNLRGMNRYGLHHDWFVRYNNDMKMKWMCMCYVYKVCWMFQNKPCIPLLLVKFEWHTYPVTLIFITETFHLITGFLVTPFVILEFGYI